MTCKDCLHYEVCRFNPVEIDQFNGCKDFKDKSRYVEQSHGVFQGNKTWNDDDIVCSVCAKDFNMLDNCIELFNYCPNCGVKMDGKEDT